MVTSLTCPASTCVMKSLNLRVVSFFWIWAKCQARKMTTSSDIHSMTVLNVAFTLTPLLARGDTDRPPLARPLRTRNGPDVRQSPVVLGVVEPVADQELVPHRLLHREGRPVHLHLDLAVSRLVDQRRHLQAARPPLADVVEQEVERDAGVDDVVEQEDVAVLVGDLRRVHDVGARGAARVLAQGWRARGRP